MNKKPRVPTLLEWYLWTPLSCFRLGRIEKVYYSKATKVLFCIFTALSEHLREGGGGGGGGRRR